MNRAAFLEAAARRDVDQAVALGLYEDLYGSPSVWRLSRSLASFDDQSGLSRVVQVAIWLGTGLLIGAHAWWSTRGYEALGAGAVLALTLAYQVAFLAAAEWARRRGFRAFVSGFAAITAFYTPLTAYSFERLLGFQFRGQDFHDFYPYASGGWIWMELVSIAVAALLLARFRRPFLMLPLTLFTAFLAADATTRFAGGWQHHRLVELVVLACSLTLLATGAALDHFGWRRFAFWPHLTAASTATCSTELLCGRHYTLGLFLCLRSAAHRCVARARDPPRARRRARLVCDRVGRQRCAAAVLPHRRRLRVRRARDLARARRQPATAMACVARAAGAATRRRVLASSHAAETCTSARRRSASEAALS